MAMSSVQPWKTTKNKKDFAALVHSIVEKEASENDWDQTREGTCAQAEKIEAKCTKSIKGRHNREPIGRKRERKENEEEVIQKMPAEQRQEEAKEILNTSKQAANEAISKRTDEEQPLKKTKYNKVAPQQTPNTKETEHQIRTLATTLEKEDKKVVDKEQEITSGAFTESITGNKCGEDHEGQIGNFYEEK